MRVVAYMAQDHPYKQMKCSEANEHGLAEAFQFLFQPGSPAVLDYLFKKMAICNIALRSIFFE